MKKFLSVIIPILTMIIVCGLCVMAYYFFYQMMNRNSSQAPQAVAGITFDEKEYPTLLAVKPMQKLMNEYYTSFTGKAINEYYDIEADEIIKKLTSGEINVAIVPDITDKQIKIAKTAGVQLETFEITKDAVVFINESSNRVTNLMNEDIIKIFSGNISNWKDVKGGDKRIKIYHPAKNSYVYNMMVQKVMGSVDVKSSEKENVIDISKALTNLDTDYYNNDGRISYTLYSLYNTMYDDVSDGVIKSDKILKINNVEPNEESFQNNNYPYTINYHIVIRSTEPQNGNVRNWIKSVLSEQGKNIAKEAGYIANR